MLPTYIQNKNHKTKQQDLSLTISANSIVSTVF